MTILDGFVHGFTYVLIFGLGVVLALISIAAIVYGVRLFRQKPFSLNPDWDATRDFIDAIPEKKND